MVHMGNFLHARDSLNVEILNHILKKLELNVQIAAGIKPAPKGRPRKDSEPRDIVTEQAYEIHRLKMENALLRDFLSLTGKE